MARAELLETGSDSDLLREMIGYVAQRLIQTDVEGLVGAGLRSGAWALLAHNVYRAVAGLEV